MTSATGLAMLPWFHRDFLAATQGWTTAECGGYFLLLGAQWEMGPLPSDATALASITRAKPKEFKALWRKVRTKFIVSRNGLVNKRLEEHRLEALRLREKHRAGAARTNSVRWGEGRGETDTPIAEQSLSGSLGESLSGSLSESLSGSPPSPSPSPSIRSKRLAMEAVLDRRSVSGLTPGPLVSVNRAVRS